MNWENEKLINLETEKMINWEIDKLIPVVLRRCLYKVECTVKKRNAVSGVFFTPEVVNEMTNCFLLPSSPDRYRDSCFTLHGDCCSEQSLVQGSCIILFIPWRDSSVVKISATGVNFSFYHLTQSLAPMDAAALCKFGAIQLRVFMGER